MLSPNYFFHLWWRNSKSTAIKGFSLLPNHSVINFGLAVGHFFLFPITIIPLPLFKTIVDFASRFSKAIPNTQLEGIQKTLKNMGAEAFDGLVEQAIGQVKQPKSNSSQVMLSAMLGYAQLDENARDEGDIRQQLNSKISQYLQDDKNNGKKLLLTLFTGIKHHGEELDLQVANGKQGEFRFGH